jgi:hypothetical protein
MVNKKTYITIVKILITVLITIVALFIIVHLSCAIVARIYFSNTDDIITNEGYTNDNELEEYFYNNKKKFDDMEKVVLSIINTNSENDSFARQQHIKQYIESLSVQFIPKPKSENVEFFVYTEGNQFWMDMGVYCSWMGSCIYSGYMWRLVEVDGIEENEWIWLYGDVKSSETFRVKRLSGRWFIYKAVSKYFKIKYKEMIWPPYAD